MVAMREVTLLPEKKRKKWTKLFVAGVVLMASTTIGIMNYNYDVLARYPYQDETSRALIRQYLNRSEIDYIIEYSIPPNMFIAFIAEPGFSIYHAAEYKKLSQYRWQETPANIVKMVEETRNVMDVDTLAAYLSDGNYAYEDIHNFLVNGDPYAPDSQLVLYAGNLDSYQDDTHTVSTRVPQGLIDLVPEIPSKDGRHIQLREDVEQPLADLCSAIQSESGSPKACAGLLIEKGYTSYQQQEYLYEKEEEAYGDKAKEYTGYPGHDEHQLGLAIDFAVDGIADDMFEKTAQSQWLVQNAWKYGFVPTRTAADVSLTGMQQEPWHYRYVGYELAQWLHDENKTFAQYKSESE